MSRGNIQVCLIGPVPPPIGGMAVQTAKLEELLIKEDLEVATIPMNLQFPKGLLFLDRLKYIRAVGRLFYYFVILFKRLNNVDLVHILSNSYLSFFLYTAPAVIIAKYYRCKIVINYRGGLAQEFLKKYGWTASRVLDMADALIVPSEFLMGIFKKYGYMPYVVPNIIDLDQFLNEDRDKHLNGSVSLLVVRNLEKMYNVACAIRAFRHVSKEYPHAELIIVGEGSEGNALKRMVSEMELKGVKFSGKVENKYLPEIYNNATVVLNPSNADNLPISVLEAFAVGIPVVSTDVGGIPFLIEDGVSGLLVDKDDDKEMAQSVLRLLKDEGLYRELSENGQKEAFKYSWKSVCPQLFAVYRSVLGEKGLLL